MKYCTRCVQPDTRPNIKFNRDGFCPACVYHESLLNIDWELRQEQLESIISNDHILFGKGYSK